MKAFWALQVADVVTTLIFLSMGIAESNPLTSFLMERFGPLGGLFLLKAVGIGIALGCGFSSHKKFVNRINLVYVAVVGLNVLTILHSAKLTAGG